MTLKYNKRVIWHSIDFTQASKFKYILRYMEQHTNATFRQCTSNHFDRQYLCSNIVEVTYELGIAYHLLQGVNFHKSPILTPQCPLSFPILNLFHDNHLPQCINCKLLTSSIHRFYCITFQLPFKFRIVWHFPQCG